MPKESFGRALRSAGRTTNSVVEIGANPADRSTIGHGCFGALALGCLRLRDFVTWDS